MSLGPEAVKTVVNSLLFLTGFQSLHLQVHGRRVKGPEAHYIPKQLSELSAA